MGLNSLMTGLADQVRRLSGETGTLGVAAMTAALEGVTAGQSGGLPEGYMQLEYIEGDGNRYIETNVVPTQNTRVVMQAICPVLSSNNWFFGARTSAGKGEFSFGASGAGGCYFAGYNTTQTRYSTGKNSSDAILIDNNKNVASLTSNGATESITFTAGTFETSVPMVLFGVNTGGTVTIGRGYIFWCKIYNGDTLIRDYIPAYCASEDSKGLYDKVNDRFYAFVGSGGVARATGTFTPTADATSISFYTGVVLSEDSVFMMMPDPSTTGDGTIVSVSDGTTYISGAIRVTSGTGSRLITHYPSESVGIQYREKDCVNYSGAKVTITASSGYYFAKGRLYRWMVIQ